MQLEKITVDEANAINNSSPAFQNLRMGDRLKNIVDAIFEIEERAEKPKNKKAKEEIKEDAE